MIPFHIRYRTEELKYALNQSDTQAFLMEGKFLGKINAMGMLLALIPDLGVRKPGKITSNEFPELKSVIYLGEEEIEDAKNAASQRQVEEACPKQDLG